MNRISPNSKSKQGGLAIVEFAVTAPLILFLLCATAEVGRALYQYTALTKAVRDGARYLADRGSVVSNRLVISTDDQNTAKTLTVYGQPSKTGANAVLPGFVENNVTVTISGASGIQVSAQYNFIPVFAQIPGFGLGSGPGLQLSTFTATAVQRSLR